MALLAVASKCPQLSSLNVAYCYHITDAAVVAVASACAHLTSLDLRGCYHITNVAVVAVASECDQLTMLDLPSPCLLYSCTLTLNVPPLLTAAISRRRLLSLPPSLRAKEIA